VEQTFIPHPLAIEQMRRGEIAGVVFITSKPIDAFLKGKWDPGFKFLPVEYGPKFEDYYLPSTLDAKDYPNLVQAGADVETIAVPTILTAYNWPTTSDRYRRVARFTEYLFSRIERLHAPGFDSKWKDRQPQCQGARSGALSGCSGLAERQHRDRRDAPMKIWLLAGLVLAAANQASEAQPASDTVTRIRACLRYRERGP
jgi:hypothetical protein